MTVLCVTAAVSIALFANNGFAQGANTVDTTTLGIGDNRATATSETLPDSSTKLAASDDASAVADTKASADGTAVHASTAASLKTASTRTITVKDPDPVVVLTSVDMGNVDTVETALTVGTTNPLPTAPHVLPDMTEDGWMTGLASGYTVEGSSNWTYSGRYFDDNCVTVAVPQGQEYLMGHAVEIVYGDSVVVATVTDTGGFAQYGRVLDLGGGVYKALGAPTVSDWGVRTVSYRFL